MTENKLSGLAAYAVPYALYFILLLLPPRLEFVVVISVKILIKKSTSASLYHDATPRVKSKLGKNTERNTQPMLEKKLSPLKLPEEN